ncbi:hypothetical protein Pint_02166 [Pistacia integerrima]|uniref:Uncharacterized protein n=1 Tax=Pistacia integerrima TaxID=434235 RepID=A0ACC0ZKF6_9ROSI|nr:hypothetical protein Pint_02166 [Pistacia integerrima]
MQTSLALTLDPFVFPLVLKSCAAITRPQLCASIHGHVTKLSLLKNPFVSCALVDAYGKCVSIYSARKVFDEIPLRNVIVWNVMISLYARNGYVMDALKLFEVMDVAPDESTFNSIIAALSKLEEGSFKAIAFYREMQELGLKPSLITLLALLPACLGKADGGESNNSDGSSEEAEKLARGESTMPERFRYLTKQAPDPPLRWPWFVALAFLIYTWRAVLFELANWRKTALSVARFVGYLLKFILALIFHFMGDPITSLIRCVETAIYSIRAFYSGIVAYTPIPELTVVIMLASAVLAIAEAAVPNAVSSQPHLLTLAGLIGYAAVKSYISEPFFWTLLLGMYGYSRLIKKKDDVTSALPVAAILAAIGEPWVRIVVMALYIALAISHHYKKLSEGKEEVEVLATDRKVPLPLLGAALAIGIRVAAKWAGYRHLTWMIV